MGVSIRFTDEDEQRVRENHGEAVADRLATTIEQKNETLQWKSSVEKCIPRFYNVIRKDGQYFPEIWFNAEHREYRAVLVWVPSYEVFVVCCVVLKEDHYQSSKQHKVLEQIYKHPHRIVSQAAQALDDAV